tara:strand:- start:43 stop:447 length:405 start_codon:yes stop_codon:yes gene_type:complete
MGKMQRSKGAAGEREAAAILHQQFQDILPNRLHRNLDQTRDGGYDLKGLPFVALEVKRCETLALPKWWEQTLAQAKSVDAVPVLMYRQSRKPWFFVLPWGILAADMQEADGYFLTNLEGFDTVYRRYLKRVGHL